jgi:hypothetical protein
MIVSFHLFSSTNYWRGQALLNLTKTQIYRYVLLTIASKLWIMEPLSSQKKRYILDAGHRYHFIRKYIIHKCQEFKDMGKNPTASFSPIFFPTHTIYLISFIGTPITTKCSNIVTSCLIGSTYQLPTLCRTVPYWIIRVLRLCLRTYSRV